MLRWISLLSFVLLTSLSPCTWAQNSPATEVSQSVNHRVLATTRTSTMEKEMNEAAEAGYHFLAVMGGETGFGGNEVVVVMGKGEGSGSEAKRQYKLLATSKTSTMQKELQAAGDEGFEYRGQTVFPGLAGQEVAVILERSADATAKRVEYRLLATKRTSTMQKELQQAGADGFSLAGMTVSKTAFGGNEIVCILQRKAE